MNNSHFILVYQTHSVTERSDQRDMIKQKHAAEYSSLRDDLQKIFREVTHLYHHGLSISYLFSEHRKKPCLIQKTFLFVCVFLCINLYVDSLLVNI